MSPRPDEDSLLGRSTRREDGGDGRHREHGAAFDRAEASGPSRAAGGARGVGCRRLGLQVRGTHE